MQFRSFLPTLFALSVTALATNAQAATFNVTRTADDTRTGSLRNAIISANATAGTDTINFALTGATQIALLSTLDITDSVIIDGYTQPGSQRNTLLTGATDATIGVEINGSGIAGSANGFAIDNTTNVQIHGLSITGFGGSAISISDSDNVWISGCFLGLTPAGTEDGNGAGITASNTTGSFFGGGLVEHKNVISGNTLDGLHFSAASNGNMLHGNLIGTDPTGKVAIGNGRNGVGIDNSDGIMIGGTGTFERNLISGNQRGISSLSCDNTEIYDNRIGTDVSGQLDLGNTAGGLFFQSGTGIVIGDNASGGNTIAFNGGIGIEMRFVNNSRILTNRIGARADGTAVVGAAGSGNAGDGVSISFGSNNEVGAAGDGNIISANGGDGVSVIGTAGTPSTGTKIIGNFIGLDGRGNARGNNNNGIHISSESNTTTIGSTATNGRNYISGNGAAGVLLDSTSSTTTLLNNYIGTDSGGTTAVPNGTDGVRISSPNNTLGNNTELGRNVISGNPGTGVAISSSGNRLLGNFIGTDFNGSNPLGNGDGVALSGAGATGNLIGSSNTVPNVISSNDATSTGYGIYISGGASSNRVRGNLIGTDVNGTLPLGNNRGIVIEDSPGNTIGAGTATTLNVIADGEYGILISGVNSQNNKVTGNYIGTSLAGTAAIPNGFGIGIFDGASSNTIGGNITTNARVGNLLSGNTNNNILISSANGNFIHGNRIGTRVDGLAALGNFTTTAGIGIAQAASGNFIGGTVGTRNVIAGNAGHGILIQDLNTRTNSVRSNYIGFGTNGTTAIPNGNSGVAISDGASQNIIGTVLNGEANHIANNGGDGVTVLGVTAGAESFGNSIRGNHIFDNDGLGINLHPLSEGASVATPNDETNRDADTGPNSLQNAPTVTAVPNGANIDVTVRLSSVPGQSYIIDLYRSTTADAVAGEGETYVASSTTTQPSGSASTTVTFSVSSAGGSFFSATATANTNSTDTKIGDTSEFSRAVGAVVTPVLTLSANPVNFGETAGTNASTGTVTRTGSLAGDLLVRLASTDTTEATVPATVTIPTGKPNVTFAIRAIDDFVDDGDIKIALRATATGFARASTAVRILDNDTAGIIVVAASPLVTTEAGGSTSFTVRLASQPTADVSVPINSSDTTEGTVDKALLTFTAANWNIAQTVTVEGENDALDDGDINYQIRLLPATSADPKYTAFDAADRAAINRDNDNPPTTNGPLAWGYNAYGQIGNGDSTRAHRSRPVLVPGYGAPTLLAAGGGHSLAAQNSATVAARAAGYNLGGQLGDSTQIDRTSPVAVSTVRNIKALAAGWYHSLALLNDGTVWAWGYNASGALGDGTTQNRTVPVQVKGLSGVIAVSAGTYHSAALKSDGTVWTWGNNYYGQIGDGTQEDRLLPIRAANLTGATAVACGGAHTLAIAGGSVYAWGWNSDGQLGDGTRTNRAKPARLADISGATRIAAGYVHSMALVGSGVRAWGDNSLGQLGRATPEDDALRPIISQVSAVADIAAGGAHSLALRTDQTLWAWGNNAYGGLGDGTTNNRVTPAPVPGLTNVVRFSGGYAHTLAIGTFTAPPGNVIQLPLSAFSSASASASTARVTLLWTTALGASAGDATKFTVAVNGRPATFSATYSATGNVTTLSLDSDLAIGDTVAVSWRGLRTPDGAAIADGSAQMKAR